MPGEGASRAWQLQQCAPVKIHVKGIGDPHNLLNSSSEWYCPKMTLQHWSLPAITIVCDILRLLLFVPQSCYHATIPVLYYDSLVILLQAGTILPHWHSWQASFRVLVQFPGCLRMPDPQLQRSHVSRHAIKLGVTNRCRKEVPGNLIFRAQSIPYTLLINVTNKWCL